MVWKRDGTWGLRVSFCIHHQFLMRLESGGNWGVRATRRSKSISLGLHDDYARYLPIFGLFFISRDGVFILLLDLCACDLSQGSCTFIAAKSESIVSHVGVRLYLTNPDRWYASFVRSKLSDPVWCLLHHLLLELLVLVASESFIMPNLRDLGCCMISLPISVNIFQFVSLDDLQRWNFIPLVLWVLLSIFENFLCVPDSCGS